MSDFNTTGYTVIRNAISRDTADFLYQYFLLKRINTATMFDTNYISKYETSYGVWNDPQCMETFSIYGDNTFDTLLPIVQPKMEEIGKFKLYPTYSYARLYKKGDVLKRHKDRFSCEISTTLNLGGDEWPIYIEPNPKEGYYTDKKYVPSKAKGIEVLLEPGDMLMYKGVDLEHWREEFKGENCGQVFLHYNNVERENAEYNKFDTRPGLGLPNWFKNYEIQNKNESN